MFQGKDILGKSSDCRAGQYCQQPIDAISRYSDFGSPQKKIKGSYNTKGGLHDVVQLLKASGPFCEIRLSINS